MFLYTVYFLIKLDQKMSSFVNKVTFQKFEKPV